MNKVTYTPFIPEYKIPEASVNLPVQLSDPIETNIDLTPAFPAETKSEDQDKEERPTITWQAAQPESKISWSADFSKSAPSKPTISGTYSDNKKFVSDLTSAYEKELESRGLSKDYAKYIVAQDALESNWGKSSLARHYNFGGVKETRKGEGVEMGTKEHDGEKMINTKASFRKFNDLNDYVKYKLDLLGNSNYDVFSYNPDQLYTRLVTAKNKYATDPDYLDKMNKMYKSILAIS